MTYVSAALLVAMGTACTETHEPATELGAHGEAVVASAGSGGPAASAFGTCVVPQQNADKCAGDGRLSCHGNNPRCPPFVGAPVTMGLVTAPYAGKLGKCSFLPEPTDDQGLSIAVRVEAVEPRVFALEGASQLETWVHLVRTDVAPHCGLMANFRSLDERPRMVVGSRLRVSSRTVQRQDKGIPGIQVVASDSGEVLYALVLSAPVTSFADDLGDLVPGLSVGVGEAPLCEEAGGATSFALELSTGAETCRVDSQASRCCTLWGKNYEVEALNVTSRSGAATAEAGFVLRARDFIHRPETPAE